jgi:hypothetical protein
MWVVCFYKRKLTTLISRLLIFSVVILTSSCYSKYLSLDYKVHTGAQYNEITHTFAFVATKLAYLNPRGITKFPDGGTPDYLVKEVSLYLYYPINHSLEKVADLNDLVEIIGPFPSRWKVKLELSDSLLYFKILPLNDWAFLLKTHNSYSDSILIDSLRDKYHKSYVLRLINFQVNESPFPDFSHSNAADLTELNKRLENEPLSIWGLNIMDIYPKSDKDYIEETIYLKNSSFKTRRAVIEQLISTMNPEEVKGLLFKMEEYQNNLEGFEKSEYELYSKETKELLKRLLK